MVTEAPDYTVDGVPAQCLPGRSGGELDPSAAALPGFSVVHLHGAITNPDSDRWAGNMATRGQRKLDVYPSGRDAHAHPEAFE